MMIKGQDDWAERPWTLGEVLVVWLAAALAITMRCL